MSISLQSQRGHSLAQSLLGLMLSMLVLMAAFTSFGWVQTNHQQLQAQANRHLSLNTSLQLLRERVLRTGAPELLMDIRGKASLEWQANALEGSNNSLSLLHPRSLTPADCQGHEASTWWWLLDDFKLSKQELQCKDSWRDDTSYQALVDGIGSMEFLYAQVLPGSSPLMQWRKAETVTDWSAVQGVKICIQSSDSKSGASSAASCDSSLSKSSTLAWQCVAAMRHHNP